MNVRRISYANFLSKGVGREIGSMLNEYKNKNNINPIDAWENTGLIIPVATSGNTLVGSTNYNGTVYIHFASDTKFFDTLGGAVEVQMHDITRSFIPWFPPMFP